jgi:hypothetical protein
MLNDTDRTTLSVSDACTYQKMLGCDNLGTQVQGCQGKAQVVVLNPGTHTAPQPVCTSGQTSQTAWHLAGGWCR